MTRFLFYCLAVFGLLVGITQPVIATEFGDISVIATTPEGKLSHGYAEFRVTVSNRSGTPHIVTLSLPQRTVGSGNTQLRSVSRTVRVEPMGTAKVELFQPNLYVGSGALGVTIDGEEQLTTVSVYPLNPDYSYSYTYGSGRPTPQVLVSQVVRDNFQKAANAVLVTPDGKPATDFVSDGLSPNQWSHYWISYSRFHGIVMDSAEFQGLPIEVKTSLQRFVECGGNLLLLGTPVSPLGLVLGQTEQNGLVTHYVGFGQWQTLNNLTLDQITPLQWEKIQDGWLLSHGPFHDPKSVSQANTEFPVVDALAIPVRGLFIMMLIFVIVIGPVNIFLLSRIKRRILLLVTVPVLSLFTCIAISSYAILSEGIRTKSRTEGLTILDETTRLSTTIGLTAFYAPLTPGGGLHFGYDTELTPQLGGYSYYSRENSGGGRTIDWSQDQHLASGWITARIPAHFQVRKAELRRERLTITPTNSESYTLVNGLGGNIKQVWFADQSGQIFESGPVPAGAQGTLKRSGKTAIAQPDTLRTIYTWNWTGNIWNFTQSPEKVLRPGCYLAWIEASPFIEEGLTSGVTRQQQSVVYGITGGIRP